jgi:flagellar protein FliS
MRQYQNFGTATAANEADPHKLIDMLLGGVVDRLASARGAILRGERNIKLQAISSAVAIIEHLRLRLDMNAGGEIAKNLSQLYDYAVKRLLKANAGDDPAMVEEVSALMRELKAGWEAMNQAPAARH